MDSLKNRLRERITILRNAYSTSTTANLIEEALLEIETLEERLINAYSKTESVSVPRDMDTQIVHAGQYAWQKILYPPATYKRRVPTIRDRIRFDQSSKVVAKYLVDESQTIPVIKG